MCKINSSIIYRIKKKGFEHVQHKHVSPQNTEKHQYSAGMFIHKISMITSDIRQTSLYKKSGGSISIKSVYTQQLHYLAEDPNISNVQSQWGYFFHGMDLDCCDQNEFGRLYMIVNYISKVFKDFDTKKKKKKLCALYLYGIPSQLFNGWNELVDPKMKN